MEPGVLPSIPQCEGPSEDGGSRALLRSPPPGALSQTLQCVPAGRELAFPLVGVTFRKRKLSTLIEEGLQALLRERRAQGRLSVRLNL